MGADCFCGDDDRDVHTHLDYPLHERTKGNRDIQKDVQVLYGCVSLSEWIPAGGEGGK